MAGNANTAEIEPTCEWSLLSVHVLHLVNGKTDVARPVEGVLEIGRGALQCLQRLLALTPYRLITAQVLHVHSDVSGARPMSAQVRIVLT